MSEYEPKTETTGSSAQTALAVGAGAVVAAVTAPLWVPVLGLGAVAAAIGTGGIAAAGGALGWWLGGKK
jgi:hypothetical protein